MRFPFVRCGLVPAALALLGAAPVRADVVFSNLGPGDTFNGTSRFALRGPAAVPAPSDAAMKFTITGGDFTFTSAELPLRHINGTNTLAILLLADAGGLPGMTLETILVTPPTGITALVTATSVTNPLLLSGHTYWIGTDATGNFSGGWAFNTTGQFGNVAFNTAGPWMLSPSSSDAAYRVSGSLATPTAAIPEPGTLSLLLVGTLTTGAGVLRRRSSGARRSEGNAAVPSK